jgi:hypothetical protein
LNVYKNSSKIFKHKVILKKSDKKLVAYNFVHNFAQRSLKYSYPERQRELTL